MVKNIGIVLNGLCVLLACLASAPATAGSSPSSFELAQTMDANGPWLQRPDGTLYKPPIYRGATSPPKKQRRVKRLPRPRG